MYIATKEREAREVGSKLTTKQKQSRMNGVEEEDEKRSKKERKRAVYMYINEKTDVCKKKKSYNKDIKRKGSK